MPGPVILAWSFGAMVAGCFLIAAVEGGRIALERWRIRAARNRATDLWLGIRP